jgi:ABC-type transport system involved in cytochrome c biogenesis permease subunit
VTLAHTALYWLAFALTLASSASYWVPATTRRVRGALLAASLLVLTGSIAARWIMAGHPPVFGTYENTLAAAWALMLLLLWMERGRGSESCMLHRRLLALWPPLTLVYGLFFSSIALPLTISERSLWIEVHVAFAWGAYAFLLSSSMAALARILRPSDEASAPALENQTIRGLGVGFALFTGVIVVGAFYGYELFAEWFRWELVEVLSVAAWIAYGLAIHAWLLFGWRGRRLAAAALATLPLLLLAFWSWSIYSGTYHYFDIVPVPAM